MQTPESINRLHQPFKCPGSAARSADTTRPSRKRKRVDYKGADGEVDDDKPYTNDDRLALATRDANRFPVFQPKEKGFVFRKTFSVPFKDKNQGAWNPSRPPPTLGLRQGAVFAPKPLHDPSGEFAIVLYDPTIDDKSKPVDNGNEDKVAADAAVEQAHEHRAVRVLAQGHGFPAVASRRMPSLDSP